MIADSNTCESQQNVEGRVGKETQYLAHMVLIAVQYLKSTFQSLSTCSVAATSVRHQDKYPLFAFAFALSCRHLIPLAAQFFVR